MRERFIHGALVLFTTDSGFRDKVNHTSTGRGWLVRSASIGASPDTWDAGIANTDIAIFDIDDCPHDSRSTWDSISKVSESMPVILAGSDNKKLESCFSLSNRFSGMISKSSIEEIWWSTIENMVTISDLRVRLARDIERPQSGATFGDIVSDSPAMARVVRLGKRAAKTDIPLLIEGEPGSGRRLIAAAIRNSGIRRGAALVTFDCRAGMNGNGPGSLFSGGSDRDSNAISESAIVRAQKGVLYLEEIGALDPDSQWRLSIALRDREVQIQEMGKTIFFECRLVASTSVDLLARVKEGRFREDLYYAISCFPISVPALRHRQGDFCGLLGRFLREASVELGKAPAQISDDLLEVLREYEWPGNVSQLQGAVFRAVALAGANVLEESDFPQIVSAVRGRLATIDSMSRARAAEASQTNTGEGAAESEILSGLGAPPACSPSLQEYGQIDLMDDDGNMRDMYAIEQEIIRFAVKHLQGNITSVARQLGIGRSTLYRKMRDREAA